MIKLYNSLSKKIEDFKPINKGEVRIYSCGPTVYNHAHIGNLSSYIYADTIRRVFEINGYKVKHVMNYTDVDDKTIKNAKDKYPDLEPNLALRKLTDEYIELFQQDIKKVGVDVDKIEFIRATDYIEQMKNLITGLLDKEVAYIADDGVYFSIDAYKKIGKTYGQLSKISQSNTNQARIDNDEYDKESVHDFALWKKNMPGEPFWNFTVNGKNLSGRPGWHIECSAMSEAALGIPFDIHTGGIDLIFPHHENEIAQSTGAIKRNVMARYFIHNNHLLVDGKKMSKSANNFYTLQDMIDKGYDPIVFRFLILQSHYRFESNFSWDLMESSRNSLQHIREWSDLRHQNSHSGALADYNKKALLKLEENLSNDLRLPDSLAYLYGAIKNVDEFGSDSNSINLIVEKIDAAFGLELLKRPDLTESQKEIITKRESVRKNRNWAESDKLRDELEKQGIGIRDTDNGPIWYRV